MIILTRLYPAAGSVAGRKDRRPMFDPASNAGQILHGMLLMLAIINPVGNIPVYVSLTHHMEEHQRTRIFNLAVITASSMMILFAFLGDWLLRHLFEVTVDEFKIAGGILLFIIAARGVLESQTRYRLAPHEEQYIAIFPLAFPIITGPGSLALTVILTQRYGQLKMVVVTLLAMAITFVFVRASYPLMRMVGPFAGQVIARLLYLFLAAKAVAMVLAGFATYWNGVMS